MAVGMARFALRRGAEHGGDVILTFHIGFLCEIQITAIGLRFAGKCVFQITFGF